jgi:hypothetical protein
VTTIGDSVIALKGAQYFQQDSGFSRSGFVSRTDGTSTFADFDGKTYGTPAIYYFTYGGTACECQCPVTIDNQCNDDTSFCRYDMLHSMKYANTTSMFGKLVDLFTFDDYQGSTLTAQNALYVLQNSNVPVYRLQRMFSGGTYQGNVTQIYSKWKAGHSIDQTWTHMVPGAASQCELCVDGRCNQVKGQTLAGLSMHMLQMAATNRV